MTTLVIAAVLGAVAFVRPLWQEAETGRAVLPGSVSWPRVWQSPVDGSPRGPATVLLSSDVHEDLPFGHYITAVGRDGSYRVIRSDELGDDAGVQVRISPDGRYVAYGHLSMPWPLTRMQLRIVDLSTGDSRSYGETRVNAADSVWLRVLSWSPDGRSVLLCRWRYADENSPREVLLTDVASGAVRTLFKTGEAYGFSAILGAFSPDGRRVAVQSAGELWTADLRTGEADRIADLGKRRRLVGSGAWTADGTRLAVADLSPAPCPRACDKPSDKALSWQIRYVDPTSGADTTGPEFDRGYGAHNVLGWRRDGAMVAVVSQENYVLEDEIDGTDDTHEWLGPDVALVAFLPGGDHQLLLDPDRHYSADTYSIGMDVSRDLLAEAYAGGPATVSGGWPVGAAYEPLLIGALTAVPVVAIGWPVLWLVRRRRREDVA